MDFTKTLVRRDVAGLGKTKKVPFSQIANCRDFSLLQWLKWGHKCLPLGPAYLLNTCCVSLSEQLCYFHSYTCTINLVTRRHHFQHIYVPSICKWPKCAPNQGKTWDRNSLNSFKCSSSVIYAQPNWMVGKGAHWYVSPAETTGRVRTPGFSSRLSNSTVALCSNLTTCYVMWEACILVTNQRTWLLNYQKKLVGKAPQHWTWRQGSDTLVPWLWNPDSR